MIADKLTNIINGSTLPVIPAIPEIPSVDEITKGMKTSIQDLNQDVKTYEKSISKGVK